MTKDDMRKLLCVLVYLKNTKEHSLWLRPARKDCEVIAYIDAAYVLHSDSTSHTGVHSIEEAKVYEQECIRSRADSTD